MKQIKLTTGEYLLVKCYELPSNNFKINNGFIYQSQMSVRISLHTGQWEIIGRANKIPYIELEKVFGFSHPFKKLLSLIKSHSMNPETTLLIKKK